MYKQLFYITILILISVVATAQNKYYTKSGKINFEASVPSFEEVKSQNNTVTAILNVSNGEIAALALVKGFRFKVALMEEHFNENYAESAKYPKATFTGEIDDFSVDNLTNEFKTFNLSGKLTFHGKTVHINPKVLISIHENNIDLTSNFTLNPKDFNIKIPKIVRKKVAETVEVTFNFMLIPKN